MEYRIFYTRVRINGGRPPPLAYAYEFACLSMVIRTRLCRIFLQLLPFRFYSIRFHICRSLPRLEFQCQHSEGVGASAQVRIMPIPVFPKHFMHRWRLRCSPSSKSASMNSSKRCHLTIVSCSRMFVTTSPPSTAFERVNACFITAYMVLDRFRMPASISTPVFAPRAVRDAHGHFLGNAFCADADRCTPRCTLRISIENPRNEMMYAVN